MVVDEQHRFGVLQRFKLMKKPNQAEPDVLVMTATPIPRTLALSLYGDLDLSVLDELPPGRTPIVTRRVPDERADEVWDFVRKQVAQGRQAYIVYPVIEGAKDDQPELDFSHDDPELASKASRQPAPRKIASQRERQRSCFRRPRRRPTRAAKSGLKSAVEMHEKLRTGPLAGLRVGLLHGRLDADEKEVIMRRFQRGEIDVLVATTVIEVGVDVPNATVMVVEHAERFGLAQLHQLRGRVGRGAAKSYCILMTGARVSPLAEERLNAMVRTQDGFELAELDLSMRGPGEFFGTRQAGLPEFRVANLRARPAECWSWPSRRPRALPSRAGRRSHGGRARARSGAAQRGLAAPLWAGGGGVSERKPGTRRRRSCDAFLAGGERTGGRGFVRLWTAMIASAR